MPAIDLGSDITRMEKNVIRVLVAEDHTIVREGIKKLIGLAKDLLVVGEASNGEQLLETLRHVPCKVVLLDISMPGVNGLEAIPRIRALNNPPAILVLSMHDEAQMAARALKVGAAGYATKDSDPALLLTAIRKVAAGGRYIDPDLADRMVFEVGLTDSRPLHSLLSEREFSVFERLAQGANVNDIAQQLALSSKNHQHPQGAADAETQYHLPGRTGEVRDGAQTPLTRPFHGFTANPCGSGLARDCDLSVDKILNVPPSSRASPLPQEGGGMSICDMHTKPLLPVFLRLAAHRLSRSRIDISIPAILVGQSLPPQSSIRLRRFSPAPRFAPLPASTRLSPQQSSITKVWV